MFNSVFSLANLMGIYSGSPLVAAVSSATFNGRNFPHNGSADFLLPLFTILAPIFFFLVLLSLAVCALMVVSWWKVFQKTGRSGWPAIVPIYNTVVMLQIVGMSPWLILLNLIPWVGQIAFFVVMIFMSIKLAKAFGKDEGFAVGLVLLPVVFVPILAFGQAKFVGLTPTAPASSSGPVPQDSSVVPPTTPTSTV